jgi:hypothetical protein
MFLTGKINLKNFENAVVPITTETTYKAFTEDEKILKDALDKGETCAKLSESVCTPINYYDFNHDQQADFVLNGKVKEITLNDGSTVEAFVRIDDPDYWTGSDQIEHQGIYFDTQSANDGAQPDLIRLADTEKRIHEQVGVLETISEADFKNTEVLVFRESTGQLMVQRKGLKDNEYDVRQTIGYNSDEQTAAYRIMLRVHIPSEPDHQNLRGQSP